MESEVPKTVFSPSFKLQKSLDKYLKIGLALIVTTGVAFLIYRYLNSGQQNKPISTVPVKTQPEYALNMVVEGKIESVTPNSLSVRENNGQLTTVTVEDPKNIPVFLKTLQVPQRNLISTKSAYLIGIVLQETKGSYSQLQSGQKVKVTVIAKSQALYARQINATLEKNQK